MLLAFDKLPAALLSYVSCLGLVFLKDASSKFTIFVFCTLSRIFWPAVLAYVSTPVSDRHLFWAQEGAQTSLG